MNNIIKSHIKNGSVIGLYTISIGFFAISIERGDTWVTIISGGLMLIGMLLALDYMRLRDKLIDSFDELLEANDELISESNLLLDDLANINVIIRAKPDDKYIYN